MGVTQSLMYAFSRACIVFTTANSSAMLSYLRGRRLQAAQAGSRRPKHTCQPCLGATEVELLVWPPPHPTPSRGFWEPVSLGRPPGWGRQAAWGWTHFSRSRAFLYSFTSCRETGRRVGQQHQ